MTHQLDYAGHWISYTIERRHRRTIGLTVRPDASVVAVGPSWARAEEIHAYVRSKAPWILKHQLRLANSGSGGSPPSRTFADGEPIPYLGQLLPLRFADTNGHIPPRATLEDGALLIQGIPPSHADEDARRAAVRRVLEDWYRQQALGYFTRACNGYAAGLGLSPAPVGISAAQRRWGSCNAQGKLRLNWRLMLAPPELADYVAAHEVAHRLEMNHSLRFWRLVAKLMPDFKARERKLDEIGGAFFL
jgi:predicted metal-dependent hydrolase